MDIVYLVVPLLLVVVVLTATLLDRWSVPVILVAMGAGILFGTDGLNLWDFNDYNLAKQIANLALVFILFNGGLCTRKDEFRSVALPAGGMATWGVLITALAVFLVLWGILGWAHELAALVAVIISSTDAGATLSILRRQSLSPRVSATVKTESAANDPMAILLTLAMVEALTTGATNWLLIPLMLVWKFVGGIGLGWLSGLAATWIYNKVAFRDRGHYYVLSIGVLLLIYGISEAVGASGMLSVFIAGYVMGNRPFVYKQGISNFSSAISTVCDILMFVLLGLLVTPRNWSDIWLEGITLFLVLTFIARPLAVAIGLVRMGFSVQERTFIAWSGLRGAVPIVLATYPLAAGIPSGQHIFDLVFFAVVLSIVIQGSTLRKVAQFFKLTVPGRPQPLYSLELINLAPSDLDLIVVDLPGPKGKRGPEIHDLQLPAGAVITLVTRNADEVVLPKGSTALLGWDQVTVLAPAKDEGKVREALTSPFETSENPVDT